MPNHFADQYLLQFRKDIFVEPEEFAPFDMVVVIPCFDEPEISKTLLSLFNCETGPFKVAVLVVVNSCVNSPERVIMQNRVTVAELNSLGQEQSNGCELFVINVENLTAKKGGVGWARKIGMDWAMAQFNHFDNPDGIIVSLDADALVEGNYLNSIYCFFTTQKEKIAATIRFEHLLPDENDGNKNEREAIILYELYMRYYRNALSMTGFPYSIYTIGSCFAVKAKAYVAQGGMNRRQAGEDFYFLHKLTMFGEIGEITATTVYPSSRVSDRVPFGTGPVIRQYCQGNRSLELTYPLHCFEVLKPFFANVTVFFERGELLRDEDLSDNDEFRAFVRINNLTEQIKELYRNCGSSRIFTSRFYHLFNAFSVLKWLNYSLANSFTREELTGECRKLLVTMGCKEEEIENDAYSLLIQFRELENKR